jgi:hypothetical protein
MVFRPSFRHMVGILSIPIYCLEVWTKVAETAQRENAEAGREEGFKGRRKGC